MSTQSTSGQSFPAPCKRCGGALYQPADLCPYCGAPHPLAAPAHARFPGADGPLHRPVAADGHGEPATPNLASPDTPIPPLSHLPLGTPVGSRWLLTRGLIALGVLILAYGAYSLLGDHHTAPAAYDEQDTKSTTGTIAPYTPQPAANGAAGAHAANRSAATPPAVVQPVVVPHYRDLAESLHAARAHEDAHDLSGAQAAVNAAFLMEPDSADAKTIQQELTPLEQRRDAALQTAQVCIKDHLWNCVAHSASDALAIDNGSPEAKTLLQQAIVQTGWAPLGSHNTPVARNAQVPQPPPSSQAAPFVTAKPAAPAPGSLDAQARAIAQSGWRNAPAAGTAATPASGAPPAH
ncbi:zinc ribbon domain-containing protein [Paraburkholderia phenazinium]|jgi:hypothetical protein|uniref:Zinc ribbon domain-containing protein n=1 Tax=Paraburkholderia phenazinium TaxID=60549 RepID=A0A1G8G4D7_9BURK|nr:zinc ribbon domain-containing protein [Paraburkholderia phenazinium]SDH89116.1 hypothetical protein SAMN05216466_114122 [Paraburkholderia phenazinium]